MKCLGLISVHGTEVAAHYARQIEDEIWHRYADKNAANLIVLSLQTSSLAIQLAERKWSLIAQALSGAMAQLDALGAEKTILCSSFLYVAAEHLVKNAPLLHIVEPTIAALQRGRHRRVALLGLRCLEEEQFWRKRFARAGIHDVFIPVLRDRHHINKLLVERFERGILNESDRADVIRVVYSLRQAGARALVVCAPPLTTVLEEAVPILPLFDAAELHAFAAVDWMSAPVSAKTGPAQATA